MITKDTNMNETIKDLYNGTIHSIKTVIPLEGNVGNPQLITNGITIQYGVLIGFTGDIKGELVITAKRNVFSSIGEVMFGMALSNDMLDSFSGEFGNMIAGGLSTQVAENGMHTDITHPTVLNGDAKLTGFKKALLVVVNIGSIGEMEVYLLLNS